MQLREKNNLIKAMKRQLKELNGTLPEMVQEMPDDDDWSCTLRACAGAPLGGHRAPPTRTLRWGHTG